jgi:hypothetical protein
MGKESRNDQSLAPVNIYNTKGTNFQRNGHSWWLGGTGIEHIYPRIKPPILEVGFSRQGEFCEHFLFGNWTRGPRAWRSADRSRQGGRNLTGAQLTGADRGEETWFWNEFSCTQWICMAIHFCHSCIFNYNCQLSLTEMLMCPLQLFPQILNLHLWIWDCTGEDDSMSIIYKRFTVYRLVVYC